MSYLYVAVGGAIGAVLRFAVGGWVTTWVDPGFPWATFVVNLSGSLLLGLLLGVLPDLATAPELRALLAVGFCGAFTTFSTFSYETVALLQDGSYGLAGAYTGGSVLLAVFGVATGLWIGTLIG